MSMRKNLGAYGSMLPLWLIPMLYVGVTIVFGSIFPRLEHEYLAVYSHGMSIGSALAVLSAIASGMLALTGVVFALAFVMVQFSAVAYSPRLVAWFGRDPVLFHALGLFVATFLYAIATMIWTDRGGNGKVPLFSTLLVVVMLIISMITFARLVQRLNDLQITSVLYLIGQRGREVIRAMFPTPTWEDYLALAFDEIRQYGVSSVQVMRRLRSALLNLVDAVTGAERKAVVRRYLDHLNWVIEHSVLDAEDRIMALQEDRQGLGLSRQRVDPERDIAAKH